MRTVNSEKRYQEWGHSLWFFHKSEMLDMPFTRLWSYSVPIFILLYPHLSILEWKYLLCAIYVFKIVLSVSMSMQVPRHSYGIQKTVLSVCSHLSACLRQSLMLLVPVYSRLLGNPCLCLSGCLQNAGAMDTRYYILVYWVLWILTHFPLINYFLVLYMFTGLQEKNALDF